MSLGVILDFKVQITPKLVKQVKADKVVLRTISHD